MTRPLVIYHGKCADGFAAAWCFWQHFGADADYYEGHYNQAPPDVLDRDVFLVDFSYKSDVVQIMLYTAKSVTLIDHHVSALNDLWPLIKSGLNMDHCSLKKSGAVLAWEYIAKTYKYKAKMPKMLAYIQDRDLWTFDLVGSKELSMYLFTHEYDFKIWDKLIRATKANITKYTTLGAILEKKHLKDIKELLCSTERYINIGGYTVPVANLPYTMASDAGMYLSAGTDTFAATYYDTDKARIFSLRSDPVGGMDVSVIAQEYGGGGHKNAAGFKVPRTHSLGIA